MHSQTYSSGILRLLDITPEKKDLKRSILLLEKEYERFLKKRNELKEEINDFENLYNAKIRRLYEHLNTLEAALFKYRNISEYVDDLFTFSEAEKVFEETMKDRRARMEDEFKKKKRRTKIIDKKDFLSAKDKAELKRLYRKLAGVFHPDKKGGNEQIMIKLNKAYQEGNLKELQNFSIENMPMEQDESLMGLKNKLFNVTHLVDVIRKEIVTLRRSDMYILKKNLLKKHGSSDETVLENLARELRKDIHRQEAELEEFMHRYGVQDDI